MSSTRRVGRGGARWWSADWGGMPVWAVALSALAIGGVLAGGAALRPSSAVHGAPDPIVVFLGDSYTAGTGASDTSLGWASLVGEAEGWRVRNLARGGTGYGARVTGEGAPAACGRDECPTFGEMAREGAALVPDIVVVSGGRNDVGGSPVDAEVAAFFDTVAAVYPESRVYVTDVLWHDDAPEGVQQLSELVHADAQRVGATWLDIGQPLAGGDGLLAPDGVHPSDAGHEAIARAVIAALR
ncbi:hypothetical protein A9Z40_12425 [Microbacterium arborescens]|uniref:SGNH hydrolase-type esterase domain-containing protein n=1 Tax=Microbacterium arborescens TaxID=33883 RepID=A0ABX2WMP3_9MICO|nr:SGNH/GDSL hydrolase family protein [Microbacterium arborescens]OAZ44198.1 hypothetical protein A9Z40_12425 [Microbacterium arborescens]